MKKKVTTTTTVTEEYISVDEGKKLTLVAVVVDRSGSMNSIYDAALSGVNEQVRILKQSAKKKGVGKTLVSFIQFDTEIDTLTKNRPANELKEFKHGDFFPRGGTSMYDATHRAIQELKSYKTDASNVAYLVIVISDGYENSSREVNASQLAQEIKTLQATDKWTFSYMLSNQDLSVVRNTLGLNFGNTWGWTTTNAGVGTAYSVNAIATNNYMDGRALRGTTATSNFYAGAGSITEPNSAAGMITGSSASVLNSASGITTATAVGTKKVKTA